MSTVTELPFNGMTPPSSPEPVPYGMIETLFSEHQFTISTTSCLFSGVITALGRRGKGWGDSSWPNFQESTNDFLHIIFSVHNCLILARFSVKNKIFKYLNSCDWFCAALEVTILLSPMTLARFWKRRILLIMLFFLYKINNNVFSSICLGNLISEK